MAVIVPSRLAPIFTRLWVPEVGPVPSKTSWRVMIILTGRPVFFDSIAATGSITTCVLPPKPPPISTGSTVTREGASPHRIAVWSRTSNWPCVLDHTVMRSSAFHHAVPL